MSSLETVENPFGSMSKIAQNMKLLTEDFPKTEEEMQTSLGYWMGKVTKLFDREATDLHIKRKEEEQIVLKYRGVTVHKSQRCSTYYARYRVGKKQYYVTGYTQRECYDKLVKAKSPQNVSKLLEEQKVVNQDISFNGWYEKWMDLYKVGKVKDETLRAYRSLYKLIPESFKNKKMKEIKLDELITLINSCEADRQQQKFYEFLNMIFQKAEDNEVIPKNIMKKIDKPKHKKTHSMALTMEQQAKLVETCKNVKYGDVIIVALYQGLRRGEVLGLTRDCVDYENKKITINKAWSQRNHFDTTKNEESVRTSPMFDLTYEILLKYKDKNPEERIFNITTKQYELMLEEVRKQSKIDNVKIKDMRSTFITNCMNRNIPVHIIQAWVGHAIGSVVTTSVYTTHNEEADKEYIQNINNFASNLHQ